jgi:YVTN family beta-propeller protein
MGKGEKNRDIRVIDARTFKQLSLIRCGIMPIAVKLSCDGKQTYVVSHGSGELHIIDNGSNKTTSVKVGKDCRDLTITRDGRWVYVTNRGDNTVSVVDVTGEKVVATVPVGKSPVGIAVDESTSIRSH